MTKRLLCLFVGLTCMVSFMTPSQAQPRCEDTEVRCFIKKYWDADDSQALSVAKCESNYDPHATNGSHYGIFQLSRDYHEWRAHELGYSWEDMGDSGKNTRVAYELYKDSGWGPWVCKA